MLQVLFLGLLLFFFSRDSSALLSTGGSQLASPVLPVPKWLYPGRRDGPGEDLPGTPPWGGTVHLHAVRGCLHLLIAACVPDQGVKYIKQHDENYLFYFGFLKIVPPPLFGLLCCFIYLFFFLKRVWEKACLIMRTVKGPGSGLFSIEKKFACPGVKLTSTSLAVLYVAPAFWVSVGIA